MCVRSSHTCHREDSRLWCCMSSAQHWCRDTCALRSFSSTWNKLLYLNNNNNNNNNRFCIQLLLDYGARQSSLPCLSIDTGEHAVEDSDTCMHECVCPLVGGELVLNFRTVAYAVNNLGQGTNYNCSEEHC